MHELDQSDRVKEAKKQRLDTPQFSDNSPSATQKMEKKQKEILESNKEKKPRKKRRRSKPKDLSDIEIEVQEQFEDDEEPKLPPIAHEDQQFT